jgi:hypothetical protein
MSGLTVTPQRRFKFIRDFGGNDVWRRQRVGEGLVLDPEDVEAELVAFEQVLVTFEPVNVSMN